MRNIIAMLTIATGLFITRVGMGWLQDKALRHQILEQIKKAFKL